MGTTNTIQLMYRNNNSPYSAAITGCGFQMREFISILPLLEASDAAKLLREEVKNNNLLQVNSQTSRDRFVSEFRYSSHEATDDSEQVPFEKFQRYSLGNTCQELRRCRAFSVTYTKD